MTTKTELTDAPEQWTKVQSLWVDAKTHANTAVQIFIDMGDLLLKLRDKYPGDLEFGKARKKYCPTLGRGDAFRAMGMARNRDRFLPAPNEPLPSVSVYAELFSASDDLVDEVLAETADPGTKNPTVKEVRERVKAESAEEFEEQVNEKPDTVPDVEQEIEPILQDWFNMTTIGRIRKFRKAKRQVDHEVAHLVLGMNPYYDGDMPVAVDIWALIRHENIARIDNSSMNGKEADFLQECVDVIQGDCYD